MINDKLKLLIKCKTDIDLIYFISTNVSFFTKKNTILFLCLFTLLCWL